MLADNQLKPFQKRVLDTDNHASMPSLHAIKCLVSAQDVLHSFTILSTGVKVDAIVGRLNEFSIYLLRTGVFYGQCSELCGSGHFGMPSVLEILFVLDYASLGQKRM